VTPQQLEALEGVVGRALSAGEIDAIDPYLVEGDEQNPNPAYRNDVEIARILSVGRKKPSPLEIGAGTILATLGEGGGAFLDALVAIGEQNRNVYWSMDLIRQGRFRIDMPAARAQMQSLAEQVGKAYPAIAAGIEALLTLGLADDPLPVAEVSRALNIADGRMVL